MYLATKNTSRKGYIYVIYDGNRHKIGRAKNVQKRLAQLQTGSASRLTIVYSRAFEDYIAAETAIHQILAAYRREGEWFALDRQAKVLLEKIMTLSNLTEQERKSLERLGLV
jgi:hypothetical protein